MRIEKSRRTSVFIFEEAPLSKMRTERTRKQT